jgi:hypothetical protein
MSLYLNNSRTVAVILVSNLALADFLFSCTMPLWIAEIIYGNAWIFGNILCKFGTFLTMINFYGSTFFLVAISIDRYFAIVHPLKVI